jgi:hypothetical protein
MCYDICVINNGIFEGECYGCSKEEDIKIPEGYAQIAFGSYSGCDGFMSELRRTEASASSVQQLRSV